MGIAVNKQDYLLSSISFYLSPKKAEISDGFICPDNIQDDEKLNSDNPGTTYLISHTELTNSSDRINQINEACPSKL